MSGQEEAVVLYPVPVIGHLISMVELGKLLLSGCPWLSVHVLLSSHGAGPIDSYIESISASFPAIHFHRLPATSLPDDFSTPSPHHEALAFELIRLNNPHVRHALLSISGRHRILSLIIDFFCYVALAVTRELSLPCYYFFTPGAAILAFFMYQPTLHEKYSDEAYRNPETLLDIPGVPLMPKKYVALPVQDRHDVVYDKFLESSNIMRESDGVIVNSFEKLEPRAIRAIRDGLCIHLGSTPPVYCIGPLISDNDGQDVIPESLRTWLEKQPRESVVFLCFGSLGVFSIEQLREIALGLERSGHRFLWVVRNPPPDRKRHHVLVTAHAEPDLESLLPDGFVDRTGDRGLVIKAWVPQVAVLSHPSMGGFVTHCGWNSVLEAVCAGVPMVAWPLYAEQGQNKVLMVDELKIALPMDEAEDGLVRAAEVERRVRQLLDSEEGDSMRERMAGLRDEAKAALSPGGSSRAALAKLVASWSDHK